MLVLIDLNFKLDDIRGGIQKRKKVGAKHIKYNFNPFTVDSIQSWRDL